MLLARWNERHFLISSGFPIKYHQDPDRLLSLIMFSQTVVEISHRKQSQSKLVGTPCSQDNCMAAPKPRDDESSFILGRLHARTKAWYSVLATLTMI